MKGKIVQVVAIMDDRNELETVVAERAAVLAVLTAFFPSEFSRLSVATVFLFAYSLSMAYTHCEVGLEWVAFAIAVLIGLFALVILRPAARLLVALVMYGVVYAGTQQMLRAFPFTPELREWLKLSPESHDRNASAGWPVSPTTRTRWSWSIGRLQAAGVAFSIG